MTSTHRTSAHQELTQAIDDVGARLQTAADEELSREIAAQHLAIRLSRCLSVDLEVSKQTGRIHAFGGVRPDTGQSVVFPRAGRNLDQALAELDDLAEGADFVLGHNLIEFDIPHLQATSPRLRLLGLPAVDTLWLNPLAFPRNPYHHLVKHYQDGQLKRGRLNDPELDARLALEAFSNQQEQLLEAPSELLAAWHWLTGERESPGFDLFFKSLRRSPRPSDADAREAIQARLDGAACRAHARETSAAAATHGWALAYALAWLSVSGGNSVMPPWVRHQFPEAGRLVQRLRDRACEHPGCPWCRERHDTQRELKRFFGFDSFRPEPADPGRTEEARQQTHDGSLPSRVDHHRRGAHQRRCRRGLLLLTAHRAKGLEFHHVVVLDGRWDRVGPEEDPDAPRRLYYVAMSRARQTLALGRLAGSHPIQDALRDNSAVLWREPVILPPPAPELSRRYRQLSLRDVYLSFAGRKPPSDRVHRAIAALSPGDRLRVRQQSDWWELVDRRRVVVGTLARGFEPPTDMRCIDATVTALVSWSHKHSDPQYHKQLQCDDWEVVVPELVFEPL